MGRYIVTAADRSYAREFMQNPMGAHSPGLMRVVNALRREVRGTHRVLVCTKPWREWRLARLPLRTGAPLTFEGAFYGTRQDAERAVFALRWLDSVGEALDP